MAWFEGWGDLEGVDADASPEDVFVAAQLAITNEIGFTVRWHVHLDIALRLAISALSPGMRVSPKARTTDMTKKLRALVKTKKLPEHAKSAVADALDATDFANQERNRVLHDRWMVNLDAEGIPRLHQNGIDELGAFTTAPKTLLDLIAISHLLALTTHRILALRVLPYIPVDDEYFGRAVAVVRNEVMPDELKTAIFDSPLIQGRIADILNGQADAK